VASPHFLYYQCFKNDKIGELVGCSASLPECGLECRLLLNAGNVLFLSSRDIVAHIYKGVHSPHLIPSAAAWHGVTSVRRSYLSSEPAAKRDHELGFWGGGGGGLKGYNGDTAIELCKAAHDWI
jgi:hypothetical protein